MTGYLARRVGRAVFVVWAAYTVTFVVLRLLPGDPVALLLAGRNGFDAVSPGDVARLRADLGLDRPLVLQYLSGLGGALHGDVGTSIQSARPVSDMIAEALPSTLLLGTAALVLALVAGTGLALLATATGSPTVAGLLRSVPALGISLPSFWVGLVLIQLFSLHWRLLPSLGDEGFANLVLPALTLAIPGAALVAQVFGRSLEATLHDPYVDTVRAGGAGPWRVLLAHGVRNAAIPAVTVVGLLVGNLLGGAVVVETVFSRPGMGRLVQDAVGTQDLPVVQGVVLVSAVAFVVVTLVVDLLYPLLDPRIRTGGEVSVA